MISLVFALAIQTSTAAPAVTPPHAAWAADARCAAALSVEAEKPDKTGEGAQPASNDPLPIEALLKMNRAAGAARAEGLERSVVERGIATFKAEYRRFDADHPAEFQALVRSCRLA